MEYVDVTPNEYEIIEIKIDNLEELQKMFTIGRVEFFEKENKYFKIKGETNYYIGIEIGAFQYEVGYWYMEIGNYLMKCNKGWLKVIDEKELNTEYKLK